MTAQVLSTIFCDQIRPEANNKLMLLGVYSKAMVVDSFPIELPSLAISCTLDLGAPTGKSRMRLQLPGEQPTEWNDADLKQKSPLETVTSIVTVSPFVAKQSGDIEFTIEVGSMVHKATLRILTKEEHSKLTW